MDTEAKAQQTQKNADLAISQRDALQAQLTDTEARAQQAQKGLELATSQRDALQAQLKETQAKAQQAQKNAELVTNQHDALQSQLKETEAKAQQVQANTDSVTKERDALQAQLKGAEAKAQAAQANTDLVTKERDALQARLNETETKAQQIQKNVGVATNQSRAPETELKNSGPAQKNSDFIANQTESEQTPPPNADLKAQTTTVSSPASVRRPAAAEVQTQGSRGSAEATVEDQEPMKLDPTDQSNAALSQRTPTPAASVKPPVAETQADKTPDDSVEEAAVKQFALGYIRTVKNDDVSTQERFFAQRVNFYGEGVLPLRRVRASNERYRREWPNRDWQPQGEAEILHSANSKKYEVLQPFIWKVSNGLQHAQGSATLRLSIRKNTKGEFHISRVQYLDR
jgi:myosin heavy subunit